MGGEHARNGVEASSSSSMAAGFVSPFVLPVFFATVGRFPLPPRRFVVVAAIFSFFSLLFSFFPLLFSFFSLLFSFSRRRIRMRITRRRRRLRGEGFEPEGRALAELSDEAAAGKSLLPPPPSAAPFLPLCFCFLEPPRGLRHFPGGQVDAQDVSEVRVEPLPDVTSAAAGQVEQRGSGPAGEGVYQLALDAVVVLFEGKGGALGAGAQGLELVGRKVRVEGVGVWGVWRGREEEVEVRSSLSNPFVRSKVADHSRVLLLLVLLLHLSPYLDRGHLISMSVIVLARVLDRVAVHIVPFFFSSFLFRAFAQTAGEIKLSFADIAFFVLFIFLLRRRSRRCC